MATRSARRAGARKPARRKAATKPRKKATVTRRVAAKRPAKKAAPRRRAAVAKRPARRAAAPVTPRAERPAPAPEPTGDVGLLRHHMDYSSNHLDEVRRFYTEVLGLRTFEFDASMNYLYVITGPSSSLGFMPPSDGPPEEWRPPREPSIYLFVEDVDRAHALLVGRDVEFLDAPADMPWGHRVARLRDPEGRVLCIASPVKTKD